jgi:hypothetical protein
VADPELKEPYDEPGSQPAADSDSEASSADKDLYVPDSAADISEKENAAEDGQEQDDSQTYRHPDQVGRGHTGSGKRSGSLRQRISANRKKVAISASLAALISAVVIALFGVILPSLKLPHLQSHLERRLARSGRTFARNVTAVTAEKVAVDLTTETEAKSLLSKSALGRTLNIYSPQTAVRTMKATGSLDFFTDPSSGKITNVIIDGRKVPAPELQFGKFWENRAQWRNFYEHIYTQTNQALLRDGQSYLVRSRVSKAMVSSFGGKLYFWQRKGADERGKKPSQVSRDTQLQLFEDVNTPTTGTAATGKNSSGGVADEAQKAIEDEKACLANAACAEKVHSGQLSLFEASGASKRAVEFADKIKSLADGPAGYLTILYSIGAPVCMIYDGSVETSKAVIEAQNSAALKTFFALNSAADQQKPGHVSAEAVAAIDKLIGNIGETNPEKLVRKEAINTTTEPYAQATRVQSYTIFDATFGPAAGLANSFASSVCPNLLSDELLYGVLGITAAQLLLPGVGKLIDTAIEKLGTRALEVPAKKATATIMERALLRFTDPIQRRIVRNGALKFGVTNGAAVAGTDAITYAARMIVISEMGALVNGADTKDLVNQADMGGVVYNNELDRQQNYGRPLTIQESNSTKLVDAEYLNKQQANKSFFQRYFALSNPNSFFSIQLINLSRLFSSPSKIPQGLAGFSSMFSGAARNLLSPFTHGVSAASNTDSTNYNLMQWGWSNEENNLIDTDPTYGDPLVNADILENTTPGQADAIAAKYNVCFTETMGTLLSDPKMISREEASGNVTDGGLCSPTNLGINNTSDPLALDTDSRTKHTGDMIFRWRLNQSYHNALNELIDIQNVGTSAGATP